MKKVGSECNLRVQFEPGEDGKIIANVTLWHPTTKRILMTLPSQTITMGQALNFGCLALLVEKNEEAAPVTFMWISPKDNWVQPA